MFSSARAGRFERRNSPEAIVAVIQSRRLLLELLSPNGTKATEPRINEIAERFSDIMNLGCDPTISDNEGITPLHVVLLQDWSGEFDKVQDRMKIEKDLRHVNAHIHTGR